MISLAKPDFQHPLVGLPGSFTGAALQQTEAI